MSTEFNSFDQSPLKAFVESPLHARNGESFTGIQSVTGIFYWIGYGSFPRQGLGDNPFEGYNETVRVKYKKRVDISSGPRGVVITTNELDMRVVDVYYHEVWATDLGVVYSRNQKADGTVDQHVSPGYDPANPGVFSAIVTGLTGDLLSQSIEETVWRREYTDGFNESVLSNPQTIEEAIAIANELMDMVALESPDTLYYWERNSQGAGTFGYRHQAANHAPFKTWRALISYERGAVINGTSFVWPNSVKFDFDNSVVGFPYGQAQRIGNGDSNHPEINFYADDRTVAFSGMTDTTDVIRVKKTAAGFQQLNCVVSAPFIYEDNAPGGPAPGFVLGNKTCQPKTPRRKTFLPTGLTDLFGITFVSSSLGPPPSEYGALPSCCG